jgi:predicted amidohydrolase
MRKLRIATCQFSEGWQPRRNAAIIRRYIAAAKSRGADVVHFHEGALSGYCGAISSPQYDWLALHEAAESVVAEARRRRIWVVLGSAHPLTPPHRPHNSLYLISPAGRIIDRYDKRFCMTKELDAYTPGDHFVRFELNGIRCGLLICYDLRFPELYCELYKMGVRVVFQSCHNAHKDGPGIHEHIMPQTLQAHAGINAMWISAPNSSAYYSRWGSVFVGPDGKITGRLPRNKAGMMINTVHTGREYYDAGSAFRARAIRGVLHSGTVVRDQRSRRRSSL